MEKKGCSRNPFSVRDLKSRDSVRNSKLSISMMHLKNVL